MLKNINGAKCLVVSTVLSGEQMTFRQLNPRSHAAMLTGKVSQTFSFVLPPHCLWSPCNPGTPVLTHRNKEPQILCKAVSTVAHHIPVATQHSMYQARQPVLSAPVTALSQAAIWLAYSLPELDRTELCLSVVCLCLHLLGRRPQNSH